MESLNVILLLKALLRVAPVFVLIKLPAQLQAPVSLRLFASLPVALILSQRLVGNDTLAVLGVEDLLIGLGIGAFVSLFFSAALKVSLFLGPLSDDEDGEANPWRQVIDSFFFVFLIMVLMALRIEQNILEVLALNPSVAKEKFFTLELWGVLLTDLTWLGLKMSSLGLILVLTQRLFEEIYRRLGGESLRLVFTFCTWISLLVVSPLIFPSFGDFVSRELSSFWKSWLGVSL